MQKLILALVLFLGATSITLAQSQPNNHGPRWRYSGYGYGSSYNYSFGTPYGGAAIGRH